MAVAIHDVPVLRARSPAASASSSDEALMLRFQAHRDEHAFRVLFGRHKDAFMSFLWRLSGRRSIAEEVSQHCWLKLIELAREGSWRAVPGATFRTYLFTIGRNRYIDAYCRDRAETATDALPEDELEDDAAAGDPPHAVAEGQRAAIVARLLAALPSEQREVVSLWMADFSIEQMARLTGAPRDTVLSRKRYALARMRRLLEAEEAACALRAEQRPAARYRASAADSAG